MNEIDKQKNRHAEADVYAAAWQLTRQIVQQLGYGPLYTKSKVPLFDLHIVVHAIVKQELNDESLARLRPKKGKLPPHRVYAQPRARADSS